MKNIFYIIKRIIMSLGILYTFNLLTSKAGFYIPINIYTIILISVFDISGLSILIILDKML